MTLSETFNLKFFYIFLFLLGHSLAAQEVTKYRWQIDSLIVVNSANFEYRFPSRHILQKQSLRITKNKFHLNEISDYKFTTPKNIKFYPTPKIGDSLFISYRRLPFNLKESYTLFEKDTLQVQTTDSTNKEKKVRVVSATFENPFEDFGKGLQKSGSIMRGVNIGSNQDLTLNSGLNLELSGQLSEDIEIVAALTDESTPIQPEGNTQTLDEVDQVFIQFKSPFVEGTVGDLNLKYQNTQFGNLSRKLQGISLLGKYNKQFAGATVATTRGFFNRVTFIGQEGNQGPYQLSGKNGETAIIVLAGTERVWINGQRMLRGESNEYIIEYANGQITFTNNKLVTSESRIEIDFEYFPAIQKYSRTALSGIVGGSLYDNSFNYKVSFYQEKDDIGKAVEEEDDLTKEEENILKLAGDDFTKASVPGDVFVGEGKGRYSKKDTLVNTQLISIFEFKGDTLGNYNVTFTEIGKGLGDYVFNSLGRYFRWVGETNDGIKKGDYMPIKLIPLPQTHQLTDFTLEWKPTQNISISSEYAISNLDKNSFSKIQNEDNSGNALSIDAQAKMLKPNIFGLHIGELDVSLNSRIIDTDFQSVDRFNNPDFQRYWNVLQESPTNNEEKSIEFSTAYRPVVGLGIGLSLGNLDRDNLKSRRYSTSVNFERKNWFKSDFRYELVNSDLSELSVNNRWRRINSMILKDVWNFQPQLLYEFENRRNDHLSILSGFRFDDFGARLGLINWNYFTGFAQVNQRNYKVYDTENDGSLVNQSTTNTNRFRLELQNVKETTASLEIIQRKKDYSKRFEEIKSDSLKLLFADAAVQDTVWQDRKTNLAELRVSHSRWKKAVSANLQYRISTEQTALRVKRYIAVSQGRGNFRFDEDLQEHVPDPDGDFVLFILPSGEFEPITKLESALRLNYDPSRFWRKPKGSLQSLLSNISGSSYFRIEEETQEEDLKAIYLLDLSKFQKGKTLRGSFVYDQNIYLMKRNRQLNFRLLYRYRDDLFNQFLDEKENEDRLIVERGFRTDWKISSLVKSQSEIRLKSTKRESEANTIRNRDIDALFLSEKIFYRPFNHWEFRFITEYGREENTAPSYPIDLWFTVAKIQANYALAGKGRITADFEYQLVEPISNPQNLAVPFEMARGKKEGISKKWQLRAEYTVSKNILFTFLYSGRDEAGFDEIIQTGQAEVRAFF